MLDKIALTLLIIGGLNWGSVGIFQFDLVAWICGGQTGIISRIVYILVGLSAIWCITLFIQGHKRHRDGRNSYQFVDFMNYCNVEANRVRQPSVLRTVERNAFKFKNTDKK